MSDIKDYKTRDEIIIKVGTSQAAEDEAAKRRGGPIDPSRPDEGILHRRRRRSGKINFYDLGQVRDGSNWIDNPWTSFGSMFANAITVIHRLDSAFSGEVFHSEFRSYLFETPLSQWTEHFRKLDYETGERYGIEVRNAYSFATPSHIYAVGRAGTRKDRSGAIISGADWTPEGLVVPEGGLSQFAVYTFQGFYSFDNHPGRYKYTLTNSYAASAVPFTLGEQADIFLMPILVNTMLDASKVPPALPGTGDFVFGRYGVESREYFLFKNYPEMPYGFFNYVRNGAGLLASVDDAEKTSLLNFVRTKRGPVREFRFASGSISELSPGTVSIDAWKTLQIGYDPFLTPPLRSFGSTGGAGMARGRLMAVIKQDDVYYYVWSGGTDPGYTIIGGDGVGIPYSF